MRPCLVEFRFTVWLGRREDTPALNSPGLCSQCVLLVLSLLFSRVARSWCHPSVSNLSWSPREFHRGGHLKHEAFQTRRAPNSRGTPNARTSFSKHTRDGIAQQNVAQSRSLAKRTTRPRGHHEGISLPDTASVSVPVLVFGFVSAPRLHLVRPYLILVVPVRFPWLVRW